MKAAASRLPLNYHSVDSRSSASHFNSNAYHVYGLDPSKKRRRTEGLKYEAIDNFETSLFDSSFDKNFALFGEEDGHDLLEAATNASWDILQAHEDIVTLSNHHSNVPKTYPLPHHQELPYTSEQLDSAHLLASNLFSGSPDVAFEGTLLTDSILAELTTGTEHGGDFYTSDSSTAKAKSSSEAVRDPLRSASGEPSSFLITSLNEEKDEHAVCSRMSSSTESSKRQPQRREAASGPLSGDDSLATRPELSEESVDMLNDITNFRSSESCSSHIVEYHEGISFALGEGGRELLRACLNVKGCKGKELQGASVPSLLHLAHQWNLWDVALRIKIERHTGKMCPQHDAFVRFKANQSQMRKHIKKEYMVTERDNTGAIARIVFDEKKKITLGKEGRESLRAQLRRLHDKHGHKMDELLARHGFKYSNLRNATVHDLSRMAYICDCWENVVNACRQQEQKREGKQQNVTGRRRSIKQQAGSTTMLSDIDATTAESMSLSTFMKFAPEDDFLMKSPSSEGMFQDILKSVCQDDPSLATWQ